MHNKTVQLVNRAVAFILILLVFLASSRSSQVQAMSQAVLPPPGSLDTTFDTDGKVTTDFGNSADVSRAILLQADGKIILAGSSSDDIGGNAFGLARYNADGSLDLNFGSHGKVIFSGDGASAEAAVLQPDGKIVVAGSGMWADWNNLMVQGFELARFNNDGTVDTSFGTDGIVRTILGSSSFMDADYAHSLLLQPDGRIIAAGTSYTNGFSDFALARYNSDGSPDYTFDGDGQLITDFGEHDYETSAILQQDGRIVLAGGYQNGGGSDIAVARYNTNGSLDTTFDGDGKLVSDLGGSEYANAVTLQPDGKMIVVGSTGSNVGTDILLARYNSSGSLDTTFDTDGKVITNFTEDEQQAMAVTLDPGGRIVIAATAILDSNGEFALARYNTNGSPDTTFDGDGKLTTAVGSGSETSYAVLLQPDGRIIATGTSDNLLNSDFAMVRYNTNGSMDTSFYHTGKVTTDFGGGSGYEHGYAVALQPDGRILVAGGHHNSNYAANFALARYSTNGSLDPTFGNDGRVTTDFGIRTQNVGYTNYARAIAVQPDGRIIVVGSSGSGGSRIALARYNTDGSLDRTFDKDGKVITDFGLSIGQGWAVALQPDGKIVVAGDNGTSNDHSELSSLVVIRYNPNGSLDTTFDGDGQVVTYFTGNDHASGRAVVIQPDGKILVAGYNYTNAAGYSIALVRYQSDGSLDTTFDGDGKVTTGFNGYDYSFAYGLALQPDGRIVVAGYAMAVSGIGGYSSQDIILARYNPNGSLDQTFDGDGKVVTDFGDDYEQAWAVALQPNGKILVGGNKRGSFALARYQSNGALDAGFGTNGIAIGDTGDDQVGGMGLQPDGKIVMAGGLSNGTVNDIALARFVGDDANRLDIAIGNAPAQSYDLAPRNVLVESYAAIQNGPVKISSPFSSSSFTSERVISGSSFNEVMGFPTNQLTTEYWFPWYDNIDMATWILVGNASSTQAATVDIYIGGKKVFTQSIPIGGQIRPRFLLKTGPVKVLSTNGVKIFTSERTMYGANSAFNEVMGYPANQFTTEYWFPWYDNSSMSTWILVGNPSTTSPAAVDIYVGGVKKGTYSIPKGSQITPRFNLPAGTGPVRVNSTNGAPIFSSERTVAGDSFNEVMGSPANQFTMEYFYPWYDNVGMSTWVLVGNPTGSTANVDIYIGGVKQASYSIGPGKQINQRFPLNTGPVRVVSTNGVKVFSSERVLYSTSFNEVMGYPGNQLAAEYWFPWYDSTSMSTDILVGRP
jgi:uncharacterized delta-60 repeat protein